MSGIIFISGRFRSGTSMLWNIFNHLPQYCAYYEPLHPNLIQHIHYVFPKQDHLGIDDYWHNYRQLPDLADHYSKNFGQSRLYLEKHDNYPELKHYIQYLINSATDKIPVLQFNRVDLRLSWLKNNFPQATIIHINRSVYPLWISARKHLQTESEKHDESHVDAYDLLQWSADLASHFPMLQHQHNRSSYFRHYFIEKLAQQMAKAHADLSVNLENNFIHSHSGIQILAKKFNWDQVQTDSIKSLIQVPQSVHNPKDKNDSIVAIEDTIDKLFEQLGLTRLFPSSPLSTIKLEKAQYWKQYPYNPQTTIEELLTAINRQKDEITALIN